MSWILLSLVPPFLFAISIYIDKILLSKYDHQGAIGALFIISCLISLPAILYVVFFTSANLANIAVGTAGALMLQGALVATYLLPYFAALKEGEPSKVIPLFQLIPVFSLVLEYLALGTTISRIQLIGMFIIVIGSIVISINLSVKNILPKAKILYLMVSSAVIFSLGSVAFKSLSLSGHFWTSYAYSQIGTLLIGFLFFIFHLRFRTSFLKVIRSAGPTFFLWNLSNELLALFGYVILYFCYSVLLAPTSLVQALQGTQPLIVLVIGLLLSILLPKLHTEAVSGRLLTQKCICIIFICLRTYLIATA